MHANLHQGNVSPAATSNSASCSITQRWCPFEEVHQRGEEGGREGGGGGADNSVCRTSPDSSAELIC